MGYNPFDVGMEKYAASRSAGNDVWTSANQGFNPFVTMANGFYNESYDSASGASSSQIVADGFQGVSGLAGGLALAAGGAAGLGASSLDVVQAAARGEAARGIDYLKSFLGPGELRAYEANPGAGSRFLGQAVHRATAAALKNSGYNYRLTGGGQYSQAKYATYTISK